MEQPQKEIILNAQVQKLKDWVLFHRQIVLGILSLIVMFGSSAIKPEPVTEISYATKDLPLVQILDLLVILSYTTFCFVCGLQFRNSRVYQKLDHWFDRIYHREKEIFIDPDTGELFEDIQEEED